MRNAIRFIFGNVKVHTSAAEGAASTRVDGGNDPRKSDSERVADCGATHYFALFVSSAIRVGLVGKSESRFSLGVEVNQIV